MKKRILKRTLLLICLKFSAYAQINDLEADASIIQATIKPSVQVIDQLITDNVKASLLLHSAMGTMEPLKAEAISLGKVFNFGFSTGFLFTFPFIKPQEAFRIFGIFDLITDSQLFDFSATVGLPMFTPYIVARGRISPKKAKSWIFPLDIFVKYGSTALVGNLANNVGTDDINLTYKNYFWGFGASVTIYKRDLFNVSVSSSFTHFQGEWSLLYTVDAQKSGILDGEPVESDLTDLSIESLQLFEINTFTAGIQLGVQTYYFGASLGIEFILNSRSSILGRTSFILSDNNNFSLTTSETQNRTASTFIPRFNLNFVLFLLEIMATASTEAIAIQAGLRFDF